MFQLQVPGSKASKIKLAAAKLETEMSHQLNKFIVTNMYTNTSVDMVYLAFEIKRLSGPFWMSLFVPSVCLILAAEISLFIDESHFEAMIMVALTSNLVMYTLYNAILEKMPEDSSLKLIDIWLLHGLLMPMIVFIVLAANELLMSKTKTGRNIMSGTKVANSTVVTSASKENSSTLTRMQTCMTICKALIPITSVLFMITFFVICAMKNQ